MVRIAIVVALVACSSSNDPPAPATGSGSSTAVATPTPSPVPTPPPRPPADAPAAASDADLDAAVVHLFDQWKDRKFAEIRDGSHPELKQTLRIDTLQRMHDTMQDVVGDFVKVTPPFHHEPDPANGDVVVTGKATFAKGALDFKLSMRTVNGQPYLTDLNLSLPKELQVKADPADAQKVARQMLDGLIHGKVKTELLDPAAQANIAPPKELEAKLKSVLEKMGTLKSIGPPLQAGCGAAQCVRYELVGAKATHVAVFEVGFKVRRWLIRSFDIGTPTK